ncbi:unnamed protein product, partial [Polarella glacialis]
SFVLSSRPVQEMSRGGVPPRRLSSCESVYSSAHGGELEREFTGGLMAWEDAVADSQVSASAEQGRALTSAATFVDGKENARPFQSPRCGAFDNVETGATKRLEAWI